MGLFLKFYYYSYYIAGVYTAVCMRRRLTHVPRNLMTSIQVMDASNNEMVALRDDEFKTYPWLKEVYLQDNKLVIEKKDN